MAIILMLVFIGMMTVGAFLIFKDRPNIGKAFFVGGGLLLMMEGVYFSKSGQSVEADRKSRTVVVSGEVIESNTTWTKEGGCVEVFTMTRTPYSFGIPCSTRKPEVGNVMMVRFIQPKKLEGNPEVLEVYDLMREIEEVHFYLPSRLKLPPAE